MKQAYTLKVKIEKDDAEFRGYRAWCGVLSPWYYYGATPEDAIRELLLYATRGADDVDIEYLLESHNEWEGSEGERDGEV